MTHQQFATRFKLANESGSSLVMVLMVIGLVGLMAAATMSLATYLAQDKTRSKRMGQVDAFAQRLTALTTDPSTCSGAPGALPVPLAGLQFFNGANYDKSSFSITPGTKQEVEIQTNSHSGTAQFLKAGATPDGMPAGVVVQSLFVQNVVSSRTNAYTADLGFRLSVDGQHYADRKVGEISMQFPAGPLPGTAMTTCELKQSSQILCENMGCKFSPAGAGLKCHCGFPEMHCLNTTPPRDFLIGVDTSGPVPQPICKPFKVSCLVSKGVPGFVLAGVDETGNPICQPLEGAPAVVCPATTTFGGPGMAAAPAGCNCSRATDTWNGTRCAPPACMAPMVWNGVSCDYVNPCPHVGDVCTNYEANSTSFDLRYNSNVNMCGCADSWADALAGIYGTGADHYDYTVRCSGGIVRINQRCINLVSGHCACV